MPHSRLLYSSEAHLLGSHQEQEAQLRQIAFSAAQANRESGLTGVLTLVQGHFIQFLEGRSAALELTFERICCDFRHKNLELIDLSPIDERAFPNWNMILLSPEEGSKIALPEGFGQFRLSMNINVRRLVEQMREAADRQDLCRAKTI